MKPLPFFLLFLVMTSLPALAQVTTSQTMGSPGQSYTHKTRVVDAGNAAAAACVTGDTLIFQGDFVNSDYKSVFLRVNHSVASSRGIDVAVGQTGHYAFAWHAPATPGTWIVRVGMNPSVGAQVLLAPIEVTVVDNPATSGLSPEQAAPPSPAPLPAAVSSKRYRYAFAFGQKATVQAGDFGVHAQILGHELVRPSSMGVSSNGDVYVADVYIDVPKKVEYPITVVFGGDGAYKTVYSNASTGGTTFDVYGNLYTAQDDFVVKTGPNPANFGGHGKENRKIDGARGIALDGHGLVYVCDFYNNRVQKFTTNGVFVTAFGSYGFQPGQFKGPTGVAVGSGGTVFVSDPGNNRIQAFSSDGTLLRTFGTAGNADGQMSAPAGIATDAAGNVYVADYGNNRVVKWSAGGQFLSSFGAQGTPENTLRGPACVFVAQNGDVYVLDSGNSRVVVFSGS